VIVIAAQRVIGHDSTPHRSVIGLRFQLVIVIARRCHLT
jgi:hypothetical protein